MEKLIVRTAAAGDAPDICRVWERSFGDAPETVRKLLEPETLENTVLAELGGHVRGFMSGFHGLDFGGVRAGYIFALCTQPEYRGRGLGAAVLRAAVRRAFERGAELVCLHPASESLAQWYAHLGLETLICTVSVSTAVLPDCGVDLRPVDAAEYAALRAEALPRVPRELLRAQELFYTGADGGFFELTGGGARGCVCVQSAENGLEIRELICPEEHKNAAAAAVSRLFGRAVSLPRTALCGENGARTHLMGLWRDGKSRGHEGRFYLPFILD